MELRLSTVQASLPKIETAALYSDPQGKAVVKSYEPKHNIFCEGDPKRSVYQIEAGAVCLYKTTEDGRRQIFDFAFPGDVIGLGATNEYYCSAQAIGHVRLTCLPISQLYARAAQDASMALKLYQLVSAELEATRDLLLTIGQLGSIERVCVFLLSLSRRNARAGKDARTITLSMTRTDIADLLGLTIETVSRSLSTLRRNKLIDISGATKITIDDVEKLQQFVAKQSCH